MFQVQDWVFCVSGLRVLCRPGFTTCDNEVQLATSVLANFMHIWLSSTLSGMPRQQQSMQQLQSRDWGLPRWLGRPTPA